MLLNCRPSSQCTKKFSFAKLGFSFPPRTLAAEKLKSSSCLCVCPCAKALWCYIIDPTHSPASNAARGKVHLINSSLLLCCEGRSIFFPGERDTGKRTHRVHSSFFIHIWHKKHAHDQMAQMPLSFRGSLPFNTSKQTSPPVSNVFRFQLKPFFVCPPLSWRLGKVSDYR